MMWINSNDDCVVDSGTRIKLSDIGPNVELSREDSHQYVSGGMSTDDARIT